jgi:hypothetical protein
MTLAILFFLFFQSTYAVGFSPNDYVHVVNFTNKPFIFKNTHASSWDFITQRIGNVSPGAHPVTALHVNTAFAQAQPLLTHRLLALRNDYPINAFNPTAEGFSLVENYWSSKFEPTSQLSESTHQTLKQLNHTLYQAAHFDGSPQSLSAALNLPHTQFPLDKKLNVIARAYNKALQDMTAILFDSKGCLKSSITEQESQKLIQIHSEYLKSTTNCLAEWYDQLAILSYGDIRYLDQLEINIRSQKSILTTITTQGPLRGIDKLASNAVGFCKTCVKWFIGSRADHEKLHALANNSTNKVITGILDHCRKGEFQAALDYGNQAGIFSQYTELHQAIESKLQNTHRSSSSAISVPRPLVSGQTVNQTTHVTQPKQLTVGVNDLPEAQIKSHDNTWASTLKAPVVAALARFQNKKAPIKLPLAKKQELAHGITQRMSQDLAQIKELTKQTVFVSNTPQQTALHKKREQALAVTEKSNVMFEKTYQVSTVSNLLAHECNADARALEYCFGNHVQQQLHGELVEIIDSSAQQYYAADTSFSQREVNKMIAEWAFVGLSRNQQGKVAQATSLANLCWATQEAIQNGLDHIGAKIDNIGDYLVNLVNKIEPFIPPQEIDYSIIDAGRLLLRIEIPSSWKPETIFLRHTIRFFQGKCKGVVDLLAHPIESTYNLINMIKPIGKLVATHIDYCDTLDSAHLLDPIACEQRLKQLAEDRSQQLDFIQKTIKDFFTNVTAEKITYAIGHMRGQYMLKRGFKCLGLRSVKTFFPITNAKYLEHFQYLAAAMKGAKPIATYTAKDIIYTLYDNGALFAGVKQGSLRKVWCVKAPCRPVNAGLISLNRPRTSYLPNARSIDHSSVDRLAKVSASLPEKPVIPNEAMPQLAHTTQPEVGSGLAEKINLVTPPQHKAPHKPTNVTEVDRSKIIDPISEQQKADWLAQKADVVKTLKKWLESYRRKVGETPDFLEHQEWLRKEIQEFNKPECQYHIATLKKGVHTIIPKEIQPFIPSQQELAQLEKHLDIRAPIEKISGKKIDKLIVNLEHIFAPEVLVDCAKVKVGVQGLHYYPAVESLEQAGLIKIHARALNPDGIHSFNWSYHGSKGKDSTCFPTNWSQEKIIQKINEAIKNIQDKITKPNGRIEIEAQTLENVKIKMIFDIEQIGEQNICTMVSCYPVLYTSKS